MGIYINKGNIGFRISRNSEYIDKSGLIAVVNATLDTEQMFSCVSRSRRFGKSMAAKMLAAYYDHSCDSKVTQGQVPVTHGTVGRVQGTTGMGKNGNADILSHQLAIS